MKIFIVTPDFSVHGGIRVILEWANRLTKWHGVYLHSLKGGRPRWFELSEEVAVVGLDAMRTCDLLLLTSPHSVHLLDLPHRPKRVMLFMQMVEHLFRPRDQEWLQRCHRFYRAPFPMIAISTWNIELLAREFGRTAPVYHVGNGVNLAHFPLELPAKDGKVVLVEGWEALNAAKDVHHVAPKVAERLRDHGYRIIAFSQVPLHTMRNVPHEYHRTPSLTALNALYRRATILLKASRFDARSCAPMEAMTKATPTARAIELGDDDLLDGENCLRCDYDVEALYQIALRMLTTPKLYVKLANGCHTHLHSNGWDTWMPIINDILTSP